MYIIGVKEYYRSIGWGIKLIFHEIMGLRWYVDFIIFKKRSLV